MSKSFFIPLSDDDAQRDRIYAGIKGHLGQGLGATFSNRKVYSLQYVHKGKRFATVGEPESGDGELVVAILYEPARRLYHVCTPNRGVVRDISILVGEDEVKSVQDFDS